MKIALLLVGCGHVGRRFIQLLDESREALLAADLDPVVVGIITKRHGGTIDDAGLDAARIARHLGEGDSIGPVIAADALAWFAQLRSQSIGARVLVETTTLDIQSGEPAIAHVRAALRGGAHVITANKGPVAFAYRPIADQAAAAGLSFLFEGAVMDGVPVFGLVRDTLPAVTVTAFRGVVNSTTNFILTALERGEPFDEALARMQAAGVAEADPSLDVDGWDAAAKAAALANVLLGAETTPHGVRREGLNASTAARAIAAASAERRLKLVASGSGRGPEARVQVALEQLALDDPLAILDGQANALELDTWPLGRLVITQRDGGLEKTAYALLADLFTVGRRMKTPR